MLSVLVEPISKHSYIIQSIEKMYRVKYKNV
jgi:hypothetical protein